MVLTVVYPSYFPALSHLGKLSSADRCIYADNFYFKKHSVINRCRIKTANGPLWLTIPVYHSKKEGQRINECIVDNHSLWQKKHLHSLTTNYNKAPFFYYYIDEVFQLINHPWNSLNELLLSAVSFVLKKLTIDQNFIISSSLINTKDRTYRLMNWLDACHCDTFLIEQHEISLVDVDLIKKSGFKLRLYTYQKIHYHQLFQPFMPDASILDLFFNEGEISKKVIDNGSNSIVPL